MTKEEIAQAAEDYLMNNNHNEDTAIRDGFKAGFYFASRNDQSEFIKLQSENERLKAERESPKKFLYDWINRNNFEGINSFDIEDVVKILSDFNEVK